jgi:hypothetical protein
MPFFCPLFRQNSTSILSTASFFKFRNTIIYNELVGKGTASVWLQQATAVGFPV